MKCPSIEDPRLIASAYARYLHDESSLRGALPARILFPSSRDELSAALRGAADAGERITISGARTGIVGGAVTMGGENLLSLEKLSSPPRTRWSERFSRWTVRAGPAATLDSLRSALEQDTGEHMFPVDPTEGGASLGGMVATNASGARTLLYGPTRTWVAGLTIALADGSLLELARGEIVANAGEISLSGRRICLPSVRIPSTKHAVGYHAVLDVDALDLFIGGEGTLGVIAGVELFLADTPPAVCGAAVFLLPGSPVEELVHALLKDEVVSPRALEYMDSHSLGILSALRAEVGPRSELPALPRDASGLLYVECAGSSDREAERRLARIADVLAAHGLADERTWAATSTQELEEIRRMRHALPERINALILRARDEVPGLTKLATDCAVPDDRLAGMMDAYRRVLDEAGLERAIFGHIGNAHLHVNILPRSQEELARAREAVKVLARAAVDFGGSVSGEHGIGKLKKELLGIQYTPAELEGLRSLKAQLDPAGILNPGVLW